MTPLPAGSSSSLTLPPPYPLAWPAGWERRPYQIGSKFKGHTLPEVETALQEELRRLGATAHVVSCNVARGAATHLHDPGVAVYFVREGRLYELACDRFHEPADNLWAIVLHIEDMRRAERHGVGGLDRALRAYLALPAPPPARPWHEVLRCHPDASELEIRAAFKSRCLEQHADRGGSGDIAALTRARDEGLAARQAVTKGAPTA